MRTAQTCSAAPCCSLPRGNKEATSPTTESSASNGSSPASGRTIASCDETDDDPIAVAKAIVAVTDAIERLAFNVGIARLMELLPSARSRDEQTHLRPAARTLRPTPRRGAVAPTRRGLLGAHPALADSRRRCPPSITRRDRRSDRRAPLRHHRGRPTISTGRDRRSGARAHRRACQRTTTSTRVVFVPDRLLNFVTRRS